MLCLIIQILKITKDVSFSVMYFLKFSFLNKHSNTNNTVKIGIRQEGLLFYFPPLNAGFHGLLESPTGDGNVTGLYSSSCQNDTPFSAPFLLISSPGAPILNPLDFFFFT